MNRRAFVRGLAAVAAAGALPATVSNAAPPEVTAAEGGADDYDLAPGMAVEGSVLACDEPYMLVCNGDTVVDGDLVVNGTLTVLGALKVSPRRDE